MLNEWELFDALSIEVFNAEHSIFLQNLTHLPVSAQTLGRAISPMPHKNKSKLNRVSLAFNSFSIFHTSFVSMKCVVSCCSAHCVDSCESIKMFIGNYPSHCDRLMHFATSLCRTINRHCCVSTVCCLGSSQPAHKKGSLNPKLETRGFSIFSVLELSCNLFLLL